MPPQLLALTDGPNILLDKPILLIGRHQECDIQIPSRKISRRHCCIAQVNDHLVVRDLGSTNGIRVNGARVVEGHLQTGDELVIGNFKYEVRLAAADRQKKKAGPIPQMELSPHLPPDESGEQPIALDDPKAVSPAGSPANRNAPPPIIPPDAIQDLDDIPHAIFPESMSLEPISEELPRKKEPPKHPGGRS